MFPYIQGGLSNRGGTQFINEVKDSTKKTRLIPFQFSVLQAYVLEFGENYIRVYKDGELVVNSAGHGFDIRTAAYKWTQHGASSEYRLELAAGGNPNRPDPIYVFEDVGGANKPLTRGTLGALTAGQFAYGDNDALGYSTIYVRLTDSVDPDTKAVGYLESSNIYEIVTTYDEDELADIKFAQTADVVYLCHPLHKMAKLTRTDHDVWTLTDLTFLSSVPTPTIASSGGTTYNYVVVAIDDQYRYSFRSNPVECGASQTINWTAWFGALSAEDKARIIHYFVYREENKGSGIYYGAGTVASKTPAGVDITSFTEGATVNIISKDVVAPEAGNTFSSTGNYPGACSFYEQRLILFRTDDQPQTVFGSRSGDYECHGISAVIQDDDAFEFTIYSNEMKEILWGIGLGQYLMIGTSDSEYFLSPGTGADYVTPSNVKIKPQSGWGSSKVAPLKIGNAVMFIDGSGRKVRDYAYSFDIDGYKGTDLSLFANHLFDGRNIVSWCYQKSPDSIVWCVLDDGSMVAMTYDKEQQVWGWHQHDTQGFYEQVMSLAEGPGVDNVYAIVKRLIDGAYVRYIELVKPRLPENSVGEFSIRNAYFVDCGLSWDNPISITDVDLDVEITVTANDHGLSDGDTIDLDEFVLSYDISNELEFGTIELNNTRCFVSDTTEDTFKIKDKNGDYIDGANMTAYLSGGVVRKAVLTLSGLDHLEGKEVAILADGYVVRNKTVNSGSVTLPFRASRIHVGLGYFCEVETLDFDTQLQTGPLKAKVRSIPKVELQLRNTRQVILGPSSDRANSEVIVRSEDDQENPVQLFTGVKEALIEASADGTGRIYAKVVDPLPLTIDGMVVSVDYDNY